MTLPSVWSELAQLHEAGWLCPCRLLSVITCPLPQGLLKWEKCCVEEVKSLEAAQNLGMRLIPSMSHSLARAGCLGTEGATTEGSEGCCTWHPVYGDSKCMSIQKQVRWILPRGLFPESQHPYLHSIFWMDRNQKTRDRSSLLRQQPTWSVQHFNLFPAHAIQDLWKQSKLLLKQLLSKTPIKNSLLIAHN